MTRIFTPAHRQALSDAAKKRAAVLPAPPGFTFRGHTHSVTAREKIAESNRRRAQDIDFIVQREQNKADRS